jgi:hypothetical protein
MGYIDRHNRFRQNILGLAKVWRTKKWQVRMVLEIFGMAVVDSFLLARKFILDGKMPTPITVYFGDM